VNELVAVLVALAGAITFGASDVIEQRATHRVAERPPLDVKLFADLVANRLWVIGITVDIAGSVMQAFALHFGPLALVQPILGGPTGSPSPGSCVAPAAWCCS
jgi:hypothetical protein